MIKLYVLIQLHKNIHTSIHVTRDSPHAGLVKVYLKLIKENFENKAPYFKQFY